MDSYARAMKNRKAPLRRNGAELVWGDGLKQPLLLGKDGYCVNVYRYADGVVEINAVSENDAQVGWSAWTHTHSIPEEDLLQGLPNFVYDGGRLKIGAAFELVTQPLKPTEAVATMAEHDHWLLVMLAQKLYPSPAPMQKQQREAMLPLMRQSSEEKEEYVAVAIPPEMADSLLETKEERKMMEDLDEQARRTEEAIARMTEAEREEYFQISARYDRAE